MRDLDRRKARRSGRVAQSEDGTTHLRLDTAGVRPHVSLVFRADSVRPRRGAAESTWTGPLPYAEVARLLGDCSLARIVADAEDVPLSVSRRVRTVPMGLWRLLVLRDGGCIVEGCDAPPGWCQVAHLDDPYAAGGTLSPDTAGLLCTAGPNHHATFDDGDFEVVWTDGRPTVDLGRGRTPNAPGTRRPSVLAREPRATYRVVLADRRITTGGSDPPCAGAPPPPDHPGGRAPPASLARTAGSSGGRSAGSGVQGLGFGADNRNRAPWTRGDPRLRHREPRRCSLVPQDRHDPYASRSRWWRGWS